jgi:hypothetical protein
LEGTETHLKGFCGPSPDVGKATQFKAGEVHNPKGKNQYTPMRDAIARLLSSDWAEEIIMAHIRAAAGKKVRPNTLAAAFLRDTLEGKPTQSLELSGEIAVTAKREIIAKRRAERLKRLNGDR